MSEHQTSQRNTATEISSDQIRERAYEIKSSIINPKASKHVSGSETSKYYKLSTKK